MTKVYSIEQGASCICDGNDQAVVTEKATAYFQDQYEADGHVGAWEEEVELVEYDYETDKEVRKTITLSGEAEKYVDPRSEHGTY